MERHDLTDDLDARLRAARPPAARVDAGAFDAGLLARVRAQPLPAPRRGPVRRAVVVPAAAGVTLAATAALMLAGGPDDVGGPSSAQALTQTLRWLDPPAGTVLHVRSVETQGGRATTHEVWQSADDPATERLAVGGSMPYEISGDALYDPATDTVYDAPPPPADDRAGDRKRAAAAAGTADKMPAGERLPAGDPVVEKVRLLLQDGRMHVTGREVHDGVPTWAVSLNADAGRPAWTLWVSADDGRPVELRDPGRDATEAPQVIRWPTYEVLTDASARALLTVAGAHPGARVVRDPVQAAAARDRLLPGKR